MSSLLWSFQVRNLKRLLLTALHQKRYYPALKIYLALSKILFRTPDDIAYLRDISIELFFFIRITFVSAHYRRISAINKLLKCAENTEIVYALCVYSISRGRIMESYDNLSGILSSSSNRSTLLLLTAGIASLLISRDYRGDLYEKYSRKSYQYFKLHLDQGWLRFCDIIDFLLTMRRPHLASMLYEHFKNNRRHCYCFFSLPSDDDSSLQNPFISENIQYIGILDSLKRI